MTEAPEYHGWAHGDIALFVREIPRDEDATAGLFVQQDRKTHLLARFEPGSAAFFMAWMDAALQETGEANRVLTARLQLLMDEPPTPDPDE